MNKLLPEIHLPVHMTNRSIDPDILDRWNPQLVARASDPEAAIDILDEIGEGFFTEGVTARGVRARLKEIGDRPVVVNINSPGGVYFEGVAIYNALREHPADVTVKILGMAASAASVIAMAGNDIQIGRAAALAIHNTQVIVGGDRNALRDRAKWLDPIDASLAEVYAARTGMGAPDVAKLLDAATLFTGDEAIDRGFADRLLDADETGEGEGQVAASIPWRKLEAVLSAGGMTRTQRRQMIKELKDDGATPGAGRDQDRDTLRAVTDTLDNYLEKLKRAG